MWSYCSYVTPRFRGKTHTRQDKMTPARKREGAILAATTESCYKKETRQAQREFQLQQQQTRHQGWPAIRPHLYFLGHFILFHMWRGVVRCEAMPPPLFCFFFLYIMTPLPPTSTPKSFSDISAISEYMNATPDFEERRAQDKTR